MQFRQAIEVLHRYTEHNIFKVSIMTDITYHFNLYKPEKAYLKKEVISCWKRVSFNIESTVELVDLPETERVVLSNDRISIICLGNKCLYSNSKTNKSDEMIELELEEVPQNCI